MGGQPIAFIISSKCFNMSPKLLVTMSPKLLLIFLIACSLVGCVASYNLTMRPDHVRISEDPQSVSFTCTADAALTGCQFRWRDDDGKVGPLLDLSRGSLSQANATHLDTELTGYSYSGRGLGAGDCGVSLQVEGGKRWMVACRVRAETGGWTYAWADLDADYWEQLPHTLTPRETVVLPGGEARLMLKAQEPLSRCRFYPPGLTLYFYQGAQSPHSTGRHRYLGGGLGGGECGLALSNVSEADNGPVASYIANTANTKDDYRFMALIVARPPGAPTLSVNYTDAGVTATCVVHEGRPVANISWLLGDVVVRQDSLDDHPGNAQDEWRWPWMQGSVMQRLTLGLQAKVNGKVLKCVASHVALAQPLEATEIISFTAPVSTATRATVQTSTAAPSPCTCHNASLGTTPDPNCTATSMLGFLCQEYRVRASQLGNTSCPRDEVYEFRVREARAAARVAELAEEQAQVILDALKADEETKAALAKVTLEAAKSSAKADEETKAALAKVALDAAKSSAKADEETKAALAKVALDAAKSSAKADEETKAALAKVTLEAAKSSAKAEEETKAALAKVTLEAAKSSAKAEEETKAALAKVTLEAAKSSAKADEETKAALAKVTLDAAKSRAKAEESRAREEEAWAKNAEEELKFERERRSQVLQQPPSPRSAQG